MEGSPVECISAITLLVAEMPSAVAFYRDLGFELVDGGPDATFSSFRAGAGYVNLQLDVHRVEPEAIWGRVIFWVDDVDAMHRRAITAGMDPMTSPTDAPWGERYFHIRDPAGHEVSFARRLDATEETV